jgi:hypothetical protein
MAKHFVVEPEQRERRAFLCLPIAPQFQQLQLAQRVEAVARIEGPAQRFLVRRLLLVMAVVPEELRALLEDGLPQE